MVLSRASLSCGLHVGKRQVSEHRFANQCRTPRALSRGGSNSASAFPIVGRNSSSSMSITGAALVQSRSSSRGYNLFLLHFFEDSASNVLQRPSVAANFSIPSGPSEVQLPSPHWTRWTADSATTELVLSSLAHSPPWDKHSLLSFFAAGPQHVPNILVSPKALAFPSFFSRQSHSIVVNLHSRNFQHLSCRISSFSLPSAPRLRQLLCQSVRVCASDRHRPALLSWERASILRSRAFLVSSASTSGFVSLPRCSCTPCACFQHFLLRFRLCLLANCSMVFSLVRTSGIEHF